MDIKKYQPKNLKEILMVIGVLIIAGFIFTTGVLVGHSRERFGRRFNENYEKNFMPISRPGMVRMMTGRGFPNGHTVVGTIIKIENNQITVKSENGEEGIINISDKTVINSTGKKLTLIDLKINNQILAIGQPNDNGTIDASLIRIIKK